MRLNLVAPFESASMAVTTGTGTDSSASLEAMANIREAIELYLETLPSEEREGLRSREILTTTC